MRLLWMCACVVVLASLGGQAAAKTGSGLYGVLTRGPITPVCTAGVPCTAPVVGARLVFARNGHDVASTMTAARGAYRIALPPGTYSVRAVSRRRLVPGTATVRAGRFRHVDLSIDTGIR